MMRRSRATAGDRGKVMRGGSAWVVGLWLGVALCASHARAEEPAADELQELQALSLEELMTLPLATGSFLQLDLYQSPLALTIIQREQIKASGARTLSELLEIYVPGFQTMVNKWNGELWGMRGVAADRNTKIIFLINGLKQNTESRDGAYTELDLGLLGDIERVEVLRGPAGLIYGSGAIAGVVNLVTRRLEVSGGELSTSYGSGNSVSGEALTTVQRGGWALTVAAGYRRSDGLGNRETRIYGEPSWPTALDETYAPAPLPDGAPADGSVGQTPGNYRMSADATHGDLRWYTRYTHREQSAGPYFLADPYPGFIGAPPDGTPPATIDGVLVAPSHPLFRYDSFGTNRGIHIVDNFSTHITYSPSIGPDTVTLEGAFIMAQNRLSIGYRDGYAAPGAESPAGSIFSSLGERRYLTGMQYVLRRVERIESATGIELRVDDLGPDFEGINMYQSVADHKNISEVRYTNVALYNETHVVPWNELRLVLGGRVDRHTRTDFVANGKGAIVYVPAPAHSIKLIGQSSANNGSADTYEHNYTHYRDDGTVSTETWLPDGPQALPPENATPAVTRAELHSLEPERADSLELTSTHFLFDAWTLMPSASYTRVSNLFAWSEALRRVVNAGAYGVLALELETQLELPEARLTLGGSHAYQRVVAPNRDPEAFTVAAWEPVEQGDSMWNVRETGETTEVEVNTIRDQVTTDGRNFLNLHTNVTKLYADYAPLTWLRLHGDLRVFWGLFGRERYVGESSARGYEHLGIASAPMLKLSLGVRFLLPDDFTVSGHLYNVLGTSENLHAVRWQHMTNPSYGDLYTVDVLTFALALEKTF
jgi:outer membrane receptor protein involved in Fe transport